MQKKKIIKNCFNVLTTFRYILEWLKKCSSSPPKKLQIYIRFGYLDYLDPIQMTLQIKE